MSEGRRSTLLVYLRQLVGTAAQVGRRSKAAFDSALYEQLDTESNRNDGVI